MLERIRRFFGFSSTPNNQNKRNEVVVIRETPLIVWAELADEYSPVTLTPKHLSAMSPYVEGTFEYDNPIGTVLKSGRFLLNCKMIEVFIIWLRLWSH